MLELVVALQPWRRRRTFMAVFFILYLLYNTFWKTVHNCNWHYIISQLCYLLRPENCNRVWISAIYVQNCSTGLAKKILLSFFFSDRGKILLQFFRWEENFIMVRSQKEKNIYGGDRVTQKENKRARKNNNNNNNTNRPVNN